MTAPGPAQGPLHGLRVIDLTDDLGRFGTKLLAEYGAAVLRPTGSGSRGRPLPGPAGEAGGVLDWWFDAAKTAVDLDLTTVRGRDRYRRLAADADLVIEARPVGELEELGLDHRDLAAGNPTLVQVSVSPFGRTGPRAHWQASDLVTGALSGVLSVTGTAEAPLNSWGGQNHNFVGFAAALCGLAGVRSARTTGAGQLVDLSAHEVMTGSIENLFMQYFYDELLDGLPKVAHRQGSLHWLGVYEVVPARTGSVMITPTPQAEQLVDWMVESGIAEAERFVGMPVEELLAIRPELMAAIRTFVATKDAGELFSEAQKRHIAFGEVQDVAQVADNPQFAHRAFYADIPVSGAEGSVEDRVRGPWRLVRFSDTPVATPAGLESPADEGAEWPSDRRGTNPAPDTVGPGEASAVPDAGPGGAAGPLPKPLDGLVVVDLSWVLAGPFSTRLLGDLGADVIKVQHEERSTLVNRPDFPYYPVWNRSKRSATLNLKHPDAIGAMRPLIERADVLVENYSAGVLDRVGLGWESVREWNDRLVYVSMAGCGHDGPWKDIISYAPTVHAVCGLTHLTNPPGRGDVGCGFSLNDHAAGFGAAVSALAALEARERTGRGQHIDMAQLEVGSYLIGPALVGHFAAGYVTEPMGNRDGLIDCVPNEVYRCRDGRHLAVSATDDDMWRRLTEVIPGLPGDGTGDVAGRRRRRDDIDTAIGAWCDAVDGEQAMELLQSAQVAAGVVQDAADLAERDPQLRARGFWLTADHDVFGPRPHDRFPGIWSRSPLEPYRLPPAYLGEANFDVWTELAGLDPAEVAEGIADGLFL